MSRNRSEGEGERGWDGTGYWGEGLGESRFEKGSRELWWLDSRDWGSVVGEIEELTSIQVSSAKIGSEAQRVIGPGSIRPRSRVSVHSPGNLNLPYRFYPLQPYPMTTL